MADTFSHKFGAAHPLEFYYTDAVTNASNTACLRVGAGVTATPMPYAGKIVAITAKSTATVSAGSIAFSPSKNGTVNTALTATLSTAAAATNATYATVTPNSIRFAAGDVIGAMFTTTTDAAPTNTNDFQVNVYVQLDPD